MITVSFKLREAQKGTPPSKQIETPVYMIFGYGYSVKKSNGKRSYKPVTFSTGERIKPAFWNGRRAKQISGFGYQNFNARLDNIESGAKEVYSEYLKEHKVKPDPQTLNNLFKERLLEKQAVIIEKLDLNSYIAKYIEDIDSGKRLTEKKTRYSKGFVKTIRNFQASFNDYQEAKRKKLDFEDITMDFYDSFVKHFTDKGHSVNNIGRLVKQLKIIMHAARDVRLHSNTEIDQRAFKVITAPVKKIYLSEEEIRKLYDLDTSKLTRIQAEARDIFLVGCYTALRFSDYSRIRPKHIHGDMLVLFQKKTGEEVYIPIRPELKKILQKYNYSLPKTYEQKVNERIKEVGKIAKINETVVIEKVKGGLKVETKQPKYKLIQSHTARRSGATNMYLAGIPSIDIMKITGHKTEREFLKYISVTKKQTAERLASHPYFTGAKLKVVE